MSKDQNRSHLNFSLQILNYPENKEKTESIHQPSLTEPKETPPHFSKSFCKTLFPPKPSNHHEEIQVKKDSYVLTL